MVVGTWIEGHYSLIYGMKGSSWATSKFYCVTARDLPAI